PNNGPYAKTIRSGIDYILTQQNSTNGYIGSSMYNHAFATKALAESYGVVDNPKIAPALKHAVELILSSQKKNRFGAWRYTPDSRDADTTVTGCQMVTLFAARNAGIGVPDEAIKKGLSFLASCRSSDGSYGYTSSSGGKATLTAVGTLCLSLAKETDSKAYQTSLAYLKKNLDYRDRYYPYYYEYYMSQALFHADEATWKEWTARNIRYLSTIQSSDGSFPGNQGASFNTAGALLSLALNFRYLPIYEK
ncbi:MAG: prenyltransferase/squalene oxidase repeat-containing protein, partial [Luteolibacter sp.]